MNDDISDEDLIRACEIEFAKLPDSAVKVRYTAAQNARVFAATDALPINLKREFHGSVMQILLRTAQHLPHVTDAEVTLALEIASNTRQ